MKRSLAVVLLVLACVVGAVCIVNAETVIPLDPNKATTVGAGQWVVKEGDNGIEVVQEIPLGGDMRFFYDDIALPENFSFEAELGCISGNNPAQRPYFGLYINASGDDFLVFRFRPSSQRWEIARAVSASSSEILMTYEDPNPWAWDLQEWRTMRFERIGNKLNTYVNGELMMSYDYDGTLNGGTVGFFAYSTAAVYRKAKLVAY
jgi:hypothetical protein